jgi:DNA-binding SARP family transcriptional activator
VPGGSSVHATGRGGGIDLGDGAFVGFGLAGAVSTALLVTRRRRRRSYVPGSGRRDDLLPVAPVVRTLHLAHLRATTPAAERIDELGDADAEADLDLGARAESVDAHLASDAADIDMDVEAGHAPRPTGASSPSPQTVALASATLPGVPAGVATRQEVAVDLAALHGLGLVGPGAAGTTRSLIVHLLTTTNSTGSSDRARSDAPVVVVPAEIAAALQFPEPTRLPARLRVVSDLTDALDAAETELLHHARLATTSATRESSRGTAAVSLGLVVVSSVPADTRRLQAIIDAGTGAGVAAILLGQWRPGTSLYVDADGTVTATSPGPGEPLRGARLFHLHPDDTAALLDQLHAADPSVSPPVAQRSDQTADMPFAGAERDGAERDGPERDSLSRPAPHRPAETLAAQPSTVFSPPGHLVAASMPMSPGGEDGPAAVVSDVVTAAQSADGAPVPGDRRESAPGFESSVLALTVFGPIRLTFSPADPHTAPANGAAVTGDITGTLSPRLRELLVLLAIHPDGITRDRLADLLWPDTPAERPFATLNKNLARLRRTIATATAGTVPEIALTFGDRHQLDPQAVQTDFRVFSDALAARRAARSDEERVLAYRHVVAAYRGELAEGLAAEWLDTSREAVRRDAVDAATSLARQLVATEPRAALDLLETGRAFDPYNEAIYCDIMRLQRRLGHSDAIERTLALLTARLGELEEQPRAETLALAQRLQTAATQTAPSPPARSTQTSR